MRKRRLPVILLCFAVLVSGCEAKVHMDVFTEDMTPYSGEGSGSDEPGLEGMTDDDQGVINI